MVLRHPCADHPPITVTFATFTGPQPNGYYTSVALEGLRVGHRAARASGRTYGMQTGDGTIELSSCENTALEGRHISTQCGTLLLVMISSQYTSKILHNAALLGVPCTKRVK